MIMPPEFYRMNKVIKFPSPASSKTLGGQDRDQFNRAALANFSSFLTWLLPEGQCTGSEYVARNPTRNDHRSGSFKIRMSGPSAGVWSDFATNDKGRDPLSLVAYIKKVPVAEAATLLNKWLEENRSIVEPDCGVSPAKRPVPIAPIRENAGGANVVSTLCPPADAEPPQRALRRLGYGKPHGIWLYYTTEGSISFYVLRWNEKSGSKMIRPLSWCQSAHGDGWRFKAWPDHRPLYNLPKIVANPEFFILVCEGEKAAVAGAKVFTTRVVTTTSSGGAKAAAKTDWSPLAGRTVRIWPDADEAGAAYANHVGRILCDLGCNVFIIDAAALAAQTPAGAPRTAPAGWDAADAINEWKDAKALRKAMGKLAKRFDPGPRYIDYGPFVMKAEGLFHRSRAMPGSEGSGGTPDGIRVCSAFEVLGESRTPHGLGWGKWIGFTDGDGGSHKLHLPNAELQGDPAIVCAKAADEGSLSTPTSVAHWCRISRGSRPNVG